MKLFEELKRRNVFRVGIAYLAIAWVLLQITDVIAPILVLPDWLARAVLSFSPLRSCCCSRSGSADSFGNGSPWAGRIGLSDRFA